MREFLMIFRMILELHMFVLRMALNVFQALGPRRTAIGCGAVILLFVAVGLLGALAQGASALGENVSRLDKVSKVVLVDVIVIVVGLLWIYPENLQRIGAALRACLPQRGQQPSSPAPAGPPPAALGSSASSASPLGMAGPSSGSGPPASVPSPAVVPAGGMLGRLMGMTQFHGHVRGVRTRKTQQRDVFGQQIEIEIWNITLELLDGQNTRCQAEMRGQDIEGMLEDNDEIIVFGRVSSGNVIHTRQIQNLTHNCDVRVTR